MSVLQRRSSLVAAIVLLGAGIFTLKGFLPALVWAGIFAIGLRPLFPRRTRRYSKHRRELLPLLFVLGVLLVFVVPLAMIAVPLISDAHAAGQWIAQAKASGVPAPAMRLASVRRQAGASLAARTRPARRDVGAGGAHHARKRLGNRADHRFERGPTPRPAWVHAARAVLLLRHGDDVVLN